jgi:tetratricopeptide (TPR) repeat protein
MRTCMIRTPLHIALAVGLAWPASANAQTALAPTLASTETSLQAGRTAVPEAPTENELAALVFYMQQKDAVAATAELRRLRVKFPLWIPPADLGQKAAAQPGTEIDVIFRQIAEGQLTDARASLASARAAYPGWVPQRDMIDLLELAEGQVALDAALAAGDADGALRIASTNDGLLRCDRINNAWRIAAVQEAGAAKRAAVGTYTAIVQACTVFPELVATVEKSDTATTTEELGALVQIVMKRFPDQTDALKDLQSRLLAGRGQGAGPGAAPQADVMADGQPLSMIRPMPRPAILPVPAAPAPVRVARAAVAPPRVMAISDHPATCLAQTEGSREVQHLFKRGWCAYKLDRPMDALAAFDAIEPKLAPAQRRDARYGQALAYLKLNMTENAARIAATTDLTQQQRVETESIILDQRGVRAYKRGEFTQAIGYFDALERVSGTLRRDLATMRGYAYLNTGNRTKARSIFQDLQNQLSTTETRKALSLTY